MLGKDQRLSNHYAQDIEQMLVQASSGDCLVAPLPCRASFGKLAILFGATLPQQA